MKQENDTKEKKQIRSFAGLEVYQRTYKASIEVWKNHGQNSKGKTKVIHSIITAHSGVYASAYHLAHRPYPNWPPDPDLLTYYF